MHNAQRTDMGQGFSPANRRAQAGLKACPTGHVSELRVGGNSLAATAPRFVRAAHHTRNRRSKIVLIARDTAGGTLVRALERGGTRSSPANESAKRGPYFFRRNNNAALSSVRSGVSALAQIVA